jgi:hypothetical protein
MILRPRLILVLLLLVLVALAGVATLMQSGGEKLVARASTKVSGDALRACLGSSLGLGAWQGNPRAMRASAFGVRVAVADNGHERQVGLFTAGGRALSSGQSSALQSCLAAK